MEKLKQATAFVQQYNEDVDKALEVISEVQEFIDGIGNAKKAHAVLIDLKAVRELQAV
ncbi:MAG: hypothetical protein KDA86_15890 [Planctomycetaceae bacterium]|nr:hypothetical protein [Planctomycetaceae bacterium]